MKGGVKQGIDNAVSLCGNLTWLRASDSFDQYHSEEIENNKNLRSHLEISCINSNNFQFLLVS